MMLLISDDDFSMPSMARTASSTMMPDCSALLRVRSTRRPTSSARRAESLTVVVISSSAAAVSSTEAACCSVRLARSSADWRISPAPASIARAFWPTVLKATFSLATELLKSSRKRSMRVTKGVSIR
ncbi:hypothetical protein D3C72_2156970 [compost metagenome]